MTLLNLNYFLKALSTNTVTLGLELQHINLGGDKSIAGNEEKYMCSTVYPLGFILAPNYN